MEADERGEPARCLRCGKVRIEGVYMHHECWSQDRGESIAWAEQWEAGARDFPRPARPAPAPSPEVPGVNGAPIHIGPIPVRADPSLKPGEWRLESPPFVVPVDFRHGVGIDIGCEPAKPAPVYGRMVGEMRDASGAPLSALGRVQAKKEPEPYVCPVDDWDLLPDAGR